MRPWPALLLMAPLLVACQPEGPPRGEPRYVIGQPYQLGGMWSYPREDFGLAETGLAAVMPDRSPPVRTANGEVFDHARLVAAHRTLQLPAIVTVTNLENGLELRVRVIERGPERPGRVIGLSRRAAQLLGVPAGGAAQVRIAVDGTASQALAGGLPSTERVELPLQAAPTGRVEREELTPLEGTRQSGRIRQAAASPALVAQPAQAGPAQVPEDPPEQLVRRPAAPGRLVLEVGRFFRRDLAQRQAARIAGIGGRVEQQGAGRGAEYRVLAGPFGSVAEADRAVQATLAQGLPEVHLRVE